MRDRKIFKRKGQASGLLSNRTGMPYDPIRDISNALPLILTNSIIMTQNQIESEGVEVESRVDALDTLAEVLGKMYVDARKELHSWIRGFSELYESLKKDENMYYVYASLCMYINLNIFAFLFTSWQTGLETGDSLEYDDYVKTYLTGCLAVMGKKEADDFIKTYPILSSSAPLPPIHVLTSEASKYMADIEKGDENNEK